MRGYSPKLILGKQVHPLFRDHIDELRELPSFYEAVRRECEWVIGQYSVTEDPYFSKYMGDVANTLMESSAIYFHLLKKHENLGAGATLGKLQLVAFIHGYASPRRVTMYVKRLVHDGRLQYSTEGSDRRVRRLVPCEPLIATARQNMAGLLTAAACLWPEQITRAAGALWPENGLAKWLPEEDAFFERLLLETGKRYLEGADPLRPYADVRHFTAKDAGSFLLFSLIQLSMGEDGVPSPNVVFAFTYSDVAAKTGVSRTHVRNVIEAAQERGLITGLGEGGRSMQVTSKMVASFESYFASLMILTRFSAAAAAIPPKTG